jgi:nucleoside-diphosphate-sugar epimerase
MTTVAITGATGFLGRATREELRSIPGVRIKLLTRSTTASEHPDEAILGDVQDFEACERLVFGADFVVHAAAIVRSKDSVALNAVNVVGTRTIARAARAAGVSRFVYVSSAGAYGRPWGRVNEASPYLATSPYERSKALAERAAAEECAGSALVIVQPSNVIGRGHPLKPLRRFLTQVARGRPVVHGGGWANYVDVDDVARVLALAVTSDDPPSKIIVNVPTRLSELVLLAEKAVGRDVRTFELPGALRRLLGPPLLGVSRRAPPIDRIAALFAGTELETMHRDWFDRHGLVMELGPVLEQMAIDYDVRETR